MQREGGRDDAVPCIAGQVGLRDLVRVLVEQEEQQVLLVPYVVVEGRGPDADLGGQPADGQLSQPSRSMSRRAAARICAREVTGGRPVRPGGAVDRGTAPSCCPPRRARRPAGRQRPSPVCAWFGLISPGGSFATDVLGPSLVAGLGFGLCLGPVVATATAGVAPHESGTASGLLTSSRQIGASLGLAALGTVAQHRTGPSTTPAALADGYALGLTVSAALLVAAVVVILTVLRRA